MICRYLMCTQKVASSKLRVVMHHIKTKKVTSEHRKSEKKIRNVMGVVGEAI